MIWAVLGIPPESPPNFARDMVARYLDLLMLKRVGIRIEEVDVFQLNCFYIIDSELQKQRKIKAERRN